MMQVQLVYVSLLLPQPGQFAGQAGQCPIRTRGCGTPRGGNKDTSSVTRGIHRDDWPQYGEVEFDTANKMHILTHTIRVLVGPRAFPDYFVPEDLDVLAATGYIVHHNSNRLGVRLLGPKPTWARENGGEGGTHPSNIHDEEYAVGTLNFTGDLPVIIAPDGPSLGGFCCPLTICRADIWKVGQLRADE